jgi:ferric-dicitrate binding protein FerR (iron transport regulator)
VRKSTDATRAYKREWAKRKYQSNPGPARERASKWRAANPEKTKVSRNASMKRWAASNPEKKRAYARAQALKKKYGLTEEAYEKLLLDQMLACAICKVIPRKRLHVDHDHTTGRVRGLLCLRCNTLVGFLEKRSDIVEMAALYLRL